MSFTWCKRLFRSQLIQFVYLLTHFSPLKPQGGSESGACPPGHSSSRKNRTSCMGRCNYRFSSDFGVSHLGYLAKETVELRITLYVPVNKFLVVKLNLCDSWHQSATSKPKCDVNSWSRQLKDTVYSGRVHVCKYTVRTCVHRLITYLLKLTLR